MIILRLILFVPRGTRVLTTFLISPPPSHTHAPLYQGNNKLYLKNTTNALFIMPPQLHRRHVFVAMLDPRQSVIPRVASF